MRGRLRWNKKKEEGGLCWMDRQSLTSSGTSVDGHFLVELEDGGDTRRLKSVFQILGAVQLGSQSKVIRSRFPASSKNCTVL